MDKYSIVKSAIALVVIIWIRKCTSDTTTIQVDYLWQEEHWKDMDWFDEINVGNDLGFKSKSELWTMPDLSAASKLDKICLLMGCGYGKKFIDFLVVTTCTISECRDLSKDNVDYAQNCWQNLEDSIQKGSRAILKLLRTFVQISSLDGGPNIDDIPFKDTLLAIQSFLEGYPTVVENGLIENETLWFSKKIEDCAESLGNLWADICQPADQIVVDEDLLWNEHRHLNTDNSIPNLCDFFVNRQNSLTAYVSDHIFNLGFDYEANGENIFFVVPTTGRPRRDLHQ